MAESPGREISLQLKNYRCFSEAHPAKLALKPGFTALVGVNNSGKSALLKFFYEFRNLFAQMQPGAAGLLHMMRTGTSVDLLGVRDRLEIFNNVNNRDIEIDIAVKGNFGAPPTAAGARAPNRVVIRIERGTMTFRASVFEGNDELRGTGPAQYQGDNLTTAGESGLIYLGVLAAATDSLRRSLYIGPFRNAIHVGTQDTYYDIQIGQSFIKQWKDQQSGMTKARSQATLRLTDEIRDAFALNRLSINPSVDDTTLQLNINEQTYRLDEVGSGMAQFIVATANAAVQRPAWVLIDEPELNLHPRLQIEFLEMLASFAEEGVIFATHSMGLARAGANAVYSLRLLGEGESVISPLEGTPQLLELLGELGFSAYHDLGYDGVLLVEGPSEIRTMKPLLRLYKKDHRYVLYPLAGGQLINEATAEQLAEMRRICNRVVALIDSERNTEDEALSAARSRFAENCKTAGIDCHVLDRRAIENYFPARAVRSVKGDSAVALQPYEKLNSNRQDWSKSEDWKIARQMRREDITGTDLGTFLESL